MKRISLFLLVVLLIFGVASTAGATAFTSSILIDGHAGLLNGPTEGDVQLFGVANYSITHDLPPLDVVADWTLEARFMADYWYSYDGGFLNGMGDFDTGVISTSLGSFAYSGSDLEATHDWIVSTVMSLPASVSGYPFGPFDISYSLLDDSTAEAGAIAFWVQGPDVFQLGQYIPALANFEGYLNVTAAPVPEPATILLFGAGLVGLAGFGRKKFMKK